MRRACKSDAPGPGKGDPSCRRPGLSTCQTGTDFVPAKTLSQRPGPHEDRAFCSYPGKSRREAEMGQELTGYGTEVDTVGGSPGSLYMSVHHPHLLPAGSLLFSFFSEELLLAPPPKPPSSVGYGHPCQHLAANGWVPGTKAYR